MVQENGGELPEKASCYKGVFYNYLSIGISFISYLKVFLFVKIVIYHAPSLMIIIQ
jgi:hypothetical protein